MILTILILIAACITLTLVALLVSPVIVTYDKKRNMPGYGMVSVDIIHPALFRISWFLPRGACRCTVFTRVLFGSKTAVAPEAVCGEQG